MQFKTVQNFAFLSVLFLISVGFLWTLRAYVMPIFWALVLAIVFMPIHEYFLKLFRKLRFKDAISASFSLLSVLLLIILPSSVLLAVFLKELQSLYYVLVQSSDASQHLQHLASTLKNVVHININPESVQDQLKSFLAAYGTGISQFAYGVGKLSVDFLLKFFVMLYILFFFFKDGQVWVKKIMDVIPLGSRNEEYLLRKFSAMVRAVFKGSLVMALVQAAIGGILFWIVGIQSPVVWAALMMLFAFIPAVGPAIIWAPAALILFINGDVTGTLVLSFGGLFLIGTVDNLLRPVLVGRGTNLPDLLIFLSVLGALAEFGMAGLVIGPTLAALFLASWELFEKKFHDDLKKWG